jgi:tyrosine-specific transport protein
MRQRTIGATLMVAGVTVGAGMLALPMTSSQVGFSKSVLLLSALWLYMVLVAIIMIEISHGKGHSIAAIAKRRLGPWGKHVAGASLLILFWALLAAYISGGSSFIHQDTQWFSSLSSTTISSLIYTLFLGVCVAACTKVVDYANRLLFIIKIVVFAVMIFGLFPLIKFSNLRAVGGSVTMPLLKAIPVFFTSFGFHGSLPTLVDYLHGSKKNLYISIVLGSFIPLVVYVLWQAVTLGVIGTSFEASGSVNLFISQLTFQTGRPYFTVLADVFAFLAITTSFLGVALGLFNYVAEWFLKELHEKKTLQTKVKASIITFALPLVFSLFYPTGFVFALGFAAIPLSLLAAVLPAIIAFKEKKSSSVFLNKGFLSLMLLVGLIVIGIEVYEKLA